MTRVDRVRTIHPDAPGPPWELYLEDDTGVPFSYAAASIFAVSLRTAAVSASIAGSMAAAVTPTADRDMPEDVPTFLFTPTPTSCASFTSATRAVITVYVGSGASLRRHDFPAEIVP